MPEVQAPDQCPHRYLTYPKFAATLILLASFAVTTADFRRDLNAICKAADSGYLLQVVREGSREPLAETDLSHWPDWPAFPADAAHAAGCELVMLGYMLWPDTATSDSLLGWRPLHGQQAWSAKVGTFAQLQATGI